MPGSRKSLIALLAVTALILIACSDDGGIDATLKDFELTLGAASAPAGAVSFNIHNDGPSAHEFVVFASDLAPADLPVDEEGLIDESGEGLALVDEAEKIAPDSDVTLDLDLDAGGYVIVCNVPGHYKEGMHAAFTVE
jgi:uncharacterized cupredoxin-like copper-binding protein